MGPGKPTSSVKNPGSITELKMQHRNDTTLFPSFSIKSNRQWTRMITPINRSFQKRMYTGNLYSTDMITLENCKLISRCKMILI